MKKNAATIQNMFSEIAGGYDRANNVLSLGVHHLWRKSLVKLSRAQVGENVLDCATGTGDLAIEFKKKVGASGSVIGCDFCADMLQKAPAKAKQLGQDIHFEVADVMNLPYTDNRFDIASISFGIRNVENPEQALAELYRVLKPGGRLLVLEFGQPRNLLLAKAYSFYSRKLLPLLGGLLTGKKTAYKYLESSASEFPCGQDFVEIVGKAAPFKNIQSRAISGGIAYNYIASK